MKDYPRKILKVLAYIEDHIHERILVEDLARVACYSSFHFQRIFRFIVGESVHKYIRRLRLERAMGKLRDTDQSVTDIALDANFETPSAFTKAFKLCIGESPRNYRLLCKKIDKEIDMAAKKIDELAAIQPDAVEWIPEMPVLFIRRTGNYSTSGEDAWGAMAALIRERNLEEAKLRYFSIAHDDPTITDEENLRFDACVQEDRNIPVKGEVALQVLQEGKCAIFVHNGSSDAISDTFDRIFLKWLPDSSENFDENRFCYLEHSGKETTKIYVPLV